MGLLTKNVLGIEITTSAKNEVLEEIEKYLKKVKSQKSKVKSEDINPLVIFTPNPEIITYAQKDPIFKRIVNSAQINIPDGVGVSWAIKKLYGVNVEKISGVDLMEDLCFWASENGVRIGLIGGRRGVALAARECLRKKHPDLKIEVFEESEIEILNIKNKKLKIHIKNKKDQDKYFISLINEIQKRKIDILFVALGFPKQEYFIAQLARTLNQEPRTKNKEQVLSSQSLVRSSTPLVLMAIGGSFDYFAGSVSRAPEWIRNGGLEWLYRLIREPWRLPRQIKGVEFFWRVLWAK